MSDAALPTDDSLPVAFSHLTTNALADLYRTRDVIILLPVGSVEPHGPHLPLLTDTLLAEESSRRAALELRTQGITALVAAALPYGVTDYATGFRGAVSLSAAMLTSLVAEIAGAYLRDGARHVCFVNHHLEPAHDAAIRAAHATFAPGVTSVACPLTRRWARLLSDEFRAGQCHAGEYETALVLAGGFAVNASYTHLPDVAISLSDGIRRGQTTFREMGLTDAYAGHPRTATEAEGERLYRLHTAMICTEVTEALQVLGSAV